MTKRQLKRSIDLIIMRYYAEIKRKVHYILDQSWYKEKKPEFSLNENSMFSSLSIENVKSFATIFYFLCNF